MADDRNEPSLVFDTLAVNVVTVPSFKLTSASGRGE